MAGSWTWSVEVGPKANELCATATLAMAVGPVWVLARKLFKMVAADKPIRKLSRAAVGRRGSRLQGACRSTVVFAAFGKCREESIW